MGKRKKNSLILSPLLIWYKWKETEEKPATNCPVRTIRARRNWPKDKPCRSIVMRVFFFSPLLRLCISFFHKMKGQTIKKQIRGERFEIVVDTEDYAPVWKEGVESWMNKRPSHTMDREKKKVCLKWRKECLREMLRCLWWCILEEERIPCAGLLRAVSAVWETKRIQSSPTQWPTEERVAGTWRVHHAHTVCWPRKHRDKSNFWIGRYSPFFSFLVRFYLKGEL